MNKPTARKSIILPRRGALVKPRVKPWDSETHIFTSPERAY